MLKELEKSILRYRTNEMMRLMFHTEDLRKYLVGSMKASNLFLEKSDERFFNEKSKVMPQVWKRLVNEKILSEAEVSDLKKIIDKRNTIAHEIQNFTRDLHVELKDYTKNHHFQTHYDYGALERLLEYKKKIQGQWKGIAMVSLRGVHFDFADKVYKEDNTKLLNRINRLYVKRSELINNVNRELAGIGFKSYEDHPLNEANFKANGSLSIRGSNICRSLLKQGISIYAVSILMDIGLDKVRYQERKIKKRT